MIIPIPLDFNWMVKGYESGFWSEGVPSGLWIPAVYKQLSRSSIIDIRKRIVGELSCARDLKHRPKTHQFYVDKEAAHRAIQQSREKHTINVSMDQLYGLIVLVNNESENQARARGARGSQTRAGSSKQGTGDNPRDCEDKSQVWECPQTERGHINWNWQTTCFGCKTSFHLSRGGT